MNEKTEQLMKNGSFWFPEAASSYAKDVDFLYYAIYYGSLITFAGILITLAIFTIKYRRKTKNQKAIKQLIHNTKLEITWTIIPLILFLIIFYWGFKGFVKITISPKEDIKIDVRGQKWFWSFTYPNGAGAANELVLPVNKVIKFKMISSDVVHSFFIPSFRAKNDVLPNYYTSLWFKPIKEGLYQVFCAEYCGEQHSMMLASIKIVSEKEYQKHLEAISSLDDIPLLDIGKKVYEQRCAICHSIDGSKLNGPSWKDQYKTKRALANGENALYDENYIRESILDPQSKIAKGFSPVMPSFAGQLKEREIEGIIEYIKNLNQKKE